MSTTTSTKATSKTEPDWPSGATYDDKKRVDWSYCRDTKHRQGQEEHRAAWDAMTRQVQIIEQADSLAEQANRARLIEAAESPSTPVAEVTKQASDIALAELLHERAAEVLDQVAARVGVEEMSVLQVGIEDRAIERGLWAKDYADEYRQAMREGTQAPALPLAWDIIEAEARVVEALLDERETLLTAIPFDSVQAKQNAARAEQIAELLGIEVEPLTEEVDA